MSSCTAIPVYDTKLCASCMHRQEVLLPGGGGGGGGGVSLLKCPCLFLELI